jgi:hypothetical protein
MTNVHYCVAVVMRAHSCMTIVHVVAETAAGQQPELVDTCNAATAITYPPPACLHTNLPTGWLACLQIQSWTPQLVLGPLWQAPANALVCVFWCAALLICPLYMGGMVQVRARSMQLLTRRCAVLQVQHQPAPPPKLSLSASERVCGAR